MLNQDALNQAALNQAASKAPSRRTSRMMAMALALAMAATVLALPPADAAGSLTVDVNAAPSILKAPGGTVTFTVVVTNTGDEPLTITSLTDSVYGNLDGKGDCAIGDTLAPDDTYTCSYQAEVTGVAGASQANVVVAKATDDENNEFSGSDTAVIVITPRLGVTKTANPSSMPPPGGTVTFDITVVNLASDSITITALTDSDFGNLATRGTCTNAVGAVLISEASSYSCSFTANVTQNHVNTVTVTASGTGGPFVATDDATVTIVAPTTSTTKPAAQPAATATTTTTLSSATAGLVLTLSQSSGVPDERFNISGSGWVVNEIVTLTFNSHTRVLGTVVADSGGRFSLNVKVPADAELGAHTITATGQAGRAVSKPFTVNAGSVTTVAGGGSATSTTLRSGTLARTGMSTGDFALLALMALMLGAAATLASPRGRLAWSVRRRSDS